MQPLGLAGCRIFSAQGQVIAVPDRQDRQERPPRSPDEAPPMTEAGVSALRDVADADRQDPRLPTGKETRADYADAMDLSPRFEGMEGNP